MNEPGNTAHDHGNEHGNSRNEVELVSQFRPETTEPSSDTMLRNRQALLERARLTENTNNSRRWTLRMPKPALAGTGTALAAGIAAIALVASGAWPGIESPRPPQSSSVQQVPPSTQRQVSLKAAQVLDAASRAARQQPNISARPDQWAYVKYVLHDPKWSRQIQIWRQVDGSEILVRTTWTDGHTSQQRRTPSQRDGTPLYTPSYHYLQSVPTDTAKLRRIVYEQAHKVLERVPEEAEASLHWYAFDLISKATSRFGGPADTQATLYQVLKTIPGVVVRENVTDAAGRRGVGITYEKARGRAMTLIFDAETHQYLGAQLPGMKRYQALVTSGIVNVAGQLP